VNDIELVGSSPKVLRKARGGEIAMIFQDPLSALNPVHRTGDQIVEMIQSHQDLSNADAAVRAVELLDIVGIPQPDQRARQYPHEFSGGMRQRVMIAMAIANDPDVLIADEPTTALDVTVQAQILDVIDRIRRDMGTAVVMITHDLGVVGESGSGKSVTFLGLLGLLPKSAKISGSAKVNGVELVGASTSTMRSVRGQQVSMIFQDPLSALNPVHRVGDQIVEMIRSHQDVSKKSAEATAVDLLGTVGIPQPKDRTNQYPHEFSGGMRQRVMIAMAIANDPQVLIADEPTTALDVTVQAQILEVIDRLRQEMRMAVVMITHDLGVIARVADRVHVMYAGRTVEKTDVESLFVAPTHPYTEGLLRSIPLLGHQRLLPIPGSPPNMLRPPSGCAFRPRCPYVLDACAGDLPELKQVGSAMSACIRSNELTLGVLT
jgi:oligopeptide/dipeptide ABC transporter ATP-binding protein